MKLHSLKLQAFGPFAGKEAIDFTTLGENPLYLIDGPTGSGKTSILHAICYALYGETTDSDRKNIGLRCDQAKDELLTEVTLEFSIKKDKYRITRSPTQMRRKKSGDGETEQQSEAHLSRVLSNGELETLVPKKVTEADKQIQQIVGLSAEQFLQVMVLPQGKFRELLIAKSDARQEILSTLFQTELYKQIEQRLKDKAASIEQQHKAYEKRKEEALEDVAARDIEELLSKLTDSKTELVEKEKIKGLAADTQQKAKTALQNAEALAKSFASLQNKQREQQNHHQQADEMTALQVTIERAQKAASIKHTADKLQELIDDVSHKQIDIKQTTQEKTTAGERVERAAADVKKEQQDYTQRDKLKTQETELLGFKVKLANYQQIQTASTLANSQYTKALDKQKTQQEEENRLTQQIVDGLKTIESLTNDVAIKATRVAEHLKAKSVFEEREKLAAAQQQYACLQTNEQAAQKSVNDAKESHQQAQKNADKIEMLWFTSQAAILAAKLEEDQPCVVCGSVDHPNPATFNPRFNPSDLDISQESVENARETESAAQQRLSDANLQLNQCKHALSDKQGRINELKETLGEHASKPVDETRLAAELSSQQLQTIEAKEKQLATAKQQQLLKVEEKEPVTVALKEIAQSLPQLNSAQATASSELTSASKGLPENYRNADSLEQAITAVQTQISQLETNHQVVTQEHSDATQQQSAITSALDVLIKNAAQLEQRKQSQEQTWKKALADSQFATQQDFEQACKADAELQTLKASLKTYEETKNKLNTEIQLLSTQLKDKREPELETLQQTVETASDMFEEAETAWTTIKQHKSKLDDTQTKIKNIENQQRHITEQFKVIGGLSKAASGRGNVRVSLERFVLGNLLDSVLSIASQRLSKMSKGQYRLIRQNEASQKKNTTAGLDLAIDDAHTGKARPVATLSGGESFMASLALALALSDVVQERSGGIQLDTLFIDEGFGSLDQESLQLAINTLVELQSTGRSIGIISHVSELKEQMAQRIDVIASRNGSTIQTNA